MDLVGISALLWKAVRWVLLLGLTGSPVFGQNQTTRWGPALVMGNDLFPSFLIATATMRPPAKAMPNHFGDWKKLIGVGIEATRPNTQVLVEVSSTKFIKPSRISVTLPARGVTYFVYPTLELDYSALRAQTTPLPETITIRVMEKSSSQNGRPMVTTKTKTVQVRSITDCPFSRGREDWRWMFAAYVNENSPIIEQILQEASHVGLTNSFADYQHDERDVLKQIFSVWYVLQNRGIKYSNIVTPSAESDQVFSQTVRPISESFQYQQANCVDRSVLFASIFRKIGLHTQLVTVPGHCFVLVYLDKKSSKPFYIETTELGNTDLGPSSRAGGNPQLAQQNRQKISARAFFQANKDASDEARKHLAMHDILFINVEQWRKLGLAPF